MYCSDQQLADRYGVSRVTIWRWRKSDPSFPQPISLSPGCVRWRLDQIEQWEAAKAKVGGAA
jgi:predicted DNA-binding transcriptional regulator AlpA